MVEDQAIRIQLYREKDIFVFFIKWTSFYQDLLF